ncbi:putative phytosulfokines 6 [Solanum dulcamara]|uniref:putative phytosulfokines 6 n=1 Tax=Solanum dulcamara TaxID=45834 RepID=UPI002486B839|nr:putative phytosulfokines 6 [Solanum dulcamara]
MERKNIVFFLFLMVLLLISYTTSARLLPATNSQENKKIESNGIISNTISSQVQEDMNDLMGIEECEEKDEVCFKRRMIAEAHLDYIYTQHKPKH